MARAGLRATSGQSIKQRSRAGPRKRALNFRNSHHQEAATPAKNDFRGNTHMHDGSSPHHSLSGTETITDDLERSRAVVIIVIPTFNRRGRPLAGRFDAFHDDQLIANASKTPFLDGARQLLKRGFAANTLVVMRHQGSPVDSLRARICDAARLTVAEGDRVGIHFQRWKAFPSSAVEAPIARARRAAAPLPLDPDDTPSSSPLRAQSMESTLQTASVETRHARSPCGSRRKALSRPHVLPVHRCGRQMHRNGQSRNCYRQLAMHAASIAASLAV
jgi:hypothetical protein